MKSIKNTLTIVTLTLLLSCSNKQSLQKYYVDNSENPNFMSVTIPADIIGSNDIDLTPKQQEAYKTVEKLNVLAFQLEEDNKTVFETEKSKIKVILKNEEYQELMRMNSGGYGGVVKYLADGDTVDEVIIYASNNEKGFALVRILGNNMTVNGMLELMQVFKKGNVNKDALKDFEKIFKQLK